MALKKVKGSIDRIFDKNLQDLVRGIRNHKDDEAHFISTCIDEIKQELKQENVSAKANATKKLIYLQMLGYDISWAAFNVIEVMSSAKFTHKRIGYMVASQSFHSETDVLMLATNLIKKDLTSQNVFDVGVALSGLSCFITPDLARDLSNDLMSLMSSTKPYIRKRAVLISYKIFLNYPEALRPAFPRLREKLEDPDPGVQSAAVNVICELARKNPKNYLSLAPVFFKLMTSSTTTNNWVLIKVIKLFGALTPLEPRLGKKLIEPLTNLIHNTSAMSLLYECINTVIQGMQDHSASIQLCVQKLRILIEDSDQNLKYLGLLALSRILKSHPKAVQAHKDLILQCLDDKDESIRLRALDLLFGMVSKKNLMEIIQKLLAHVQKAETIQYRDELISKIIEICSRNNFYFITNFEWYLTVLVELTRVDGASRHGSLVSSQILDVAIRVKTIRPFAANKVAVILQNSHALSILLRRNGMIEVLYAAAYICGEFGQNIDNLEAVLFSMLDPHVLHHPTHIQHIFIQNMIKLFALHLAKVEEEGGCEAALQLTKIVQEKLVIFVNSSNLEVQERASCASALLKQLEKMLSKSTPVAVQFAALFKGELNPVAPKAQKRVPLPEGLDLDVWINDPPSSSSESEDEEVARDMGGRENNAFYPATKKESRPEISPEEMKKRKAARKAEQASNPNYLTAAAKKEEDVSEYQKPDAEVEAEELSSIDSVPLRVPGLSSSDQYMKLEQQRRRLAKSTTEKQKKASSKGKKGKKSKLAEQAKAQKTEEEIFAIHKVEIVDYEMPEGALNSESDDGSKSDIYKALDIDLEPPISHVEDVQMKKSKKKTKQSTKKDEQLAPTSMEKPKSKKKSSKKTGLKKSKKSKDTTTVVEELNGEDKNHQQLDDVPEIKIEESISNMSINEAAVEDVVGVIEGEKKEKKSKKSKSKKGEKKEKKKKKSSKTEKIAEVETVKHNYQLLAEDKQVRVEYETRASSKEGNMISLYCIFTNLTDELLSDVTFNLTDTLNTKLVRNGVSSTEACKLPFSLYPHSSNEASFSLTASSVVMPQRLRGNININHNHQLDFKLYLPCSSYLLSTSCSSDAFAKLLASDALTDKSSARLMSPNLQFTDMLQLISKISFTVVEQIGENASLYGMSIQGHHLCLLIKKVTNGFSVEGKGNNQSILSNVIDEIKLLVPTP